PGSLDRDEVKALRARLAAIFCANVQVKCGLKIVAGIKLLDRNSIKRAGRSGLVKNNHMVNTQGRFQPELHLFSVKEVLGVGKLRVGIVEQVVLQVRKVV